MPYTMLNHEQILLFTTATLLACVAATLFVVLRIRRTFCETREASAASRRRRQTRDEKSPRKGEETKESANEEDVDEDHDGTFVVAFFHPRCSAGGGGERVLWKSIQALGEMKEEGRRQFLESTKKNIAAETREENSDNSNDDPDGEFTGDDVDDDRATNCRNLSVVVYTVDEPSADYDEQVIEKVRERFSIVIPPSLPVHFVHLHEAKYLLDKPKRFTMIVESWGTMKLAWHALSAVTPNVYVDTTGCAFTFFVAKVLAGCRVVTYVHYPTISTDMLSLVWERRPSYNNDSKIATNPLTTYVKLSYYAAFAICYGLVGSLADLTMVNSSWTKGHIQYLWKLAGKIHVVFPPVDTKSLKDLPLAGRENLIVSIGQFRPEKDHALQLRSFARLLEMGDGAMRASGAELVLIGSCRGEDDEERVDALRRLARELDVQDRVTFVLNRPYPVLRDYLRRASVGVHTMWNEHFGIGVVEMMAAGLVTVAHASGGPASDIILRPWDFEDPSTWSDGGEPTGCLASTAEEYAAAMYEVLRRDALSDEILEIRENGRKSADRFSDEVFMDSFKETMLPSFKK